MTSLKYRNGEPILSMNKKPSSWGDEEIDHLKNPGKTCKKITIVKYLIKIVRNGHEK